MKVLVFQHYHKAPNSTNPKITRISKLTEHLMTKCISSMKKYCEINKYDYYLDNETLHYNYYLNRWSNLCLERWVLASIKASEGDYEVIVVVDSDFLAVSDEPLPYCSGVTGLHNASHNPLTTKSIPKEYYKYVLCGGITLWWKQHLQDFAAFVNSIAGHSGTRKQLPLSVLKSHDESFITHFLHKNSHINCNYLDYSFNIKKWKKIPDNPTFFHLQGPFNLKLQSYKSLPKEIRSRVLQ
tara:strand:+ start:1576 stop:2295 length:720 start_codon:yes stop_codon:yes gene_type:complete